MWALFFAVNMIAMAALSFAAPAMGLWMPEGVSTHAADVDSLFNIILLITTFFFILTEAILIIFLWKYGSGSKPEGAPAVPAFLKPIGGLIDTPHKIELAWTIVPAAILLYIALTQVNTWATVKYQSRMAELVDKKATIRVELSARQFEWRFRYPSANRARDWLKSPEAEKADMDSFANNPHSDDIHVVNELHIWQDSPAMVLLSTRDVLHSFNLPHFRVKQDALPGKIIPVWFTPTKTNCEKNSKTGRWEDGYNPTTKKFYSATRDNADKGLEEQRFIWDIPCAELCGWGHWRMVGRVYVHRNQEDFLAWLEQTGKSEHSKTAVK